MIPVLQNLLGPDGLSLAAAAGTAIGLRGERNNISMLGIDPTTGDVVIDEFALQFAPESVEDSIEIGWSDQEIPGASHSLMHWTSNGGRTISFEIVLMRLMDYEMPLSGALEQPSSRLNRKFNDPVDMTIKRLRAFCYPIYDDSTDQYEVRSPPICALNIPGMALNEDGSDVIFTVMTDCSVTYEKAFESTGYTRSARVSLGFKQVVQDAHGHAPQFKYIRANSGTINAGSSGAQGPIGQGIEAVGPIGRSEKTISDDNYSRVSQKSREITKARVQGNLKP